MKLVYTLKTHTHTCQFTHFSSYAPWRIKTAWVKALFQRAVKISSTEESLNQQMKKILCRGMDSPIISQRHYYTV